MLSVCLMHRPRCYIVRIRFKKRIKGTRMARRIPIVLTDEEQRKLLTQPNPRYPTGERNRLMLWLILDTGLRLSEVLNLEWRDIDLLTGRLHVRRGKGAKDRVLWVGEELLEALRHWRQRQAEIVGKPVSWVFSTLDGKPLQARYVQMMVQRYARKAGIEKRVTPHTLRHTFATDLLRACGNVEIVRRALGHERLSTTQIYVHLVDEDLERALKVFRGNRQQSRKT